MFEYINTSLLGDRLVLKKTADDPYPLALTLAQARALANARANIEAFVEDCRDFSEMHKQARFPLDGGVFLIKAEQLELVLLEIKEVSKFARGGRN